MLQTFLEYGASAGKFTACALGIGQGFARGAGFGLFGANGLAGTSLSLNRCGRGSFGVSDTCRHRFLRACCRLDLGVQFGQSVLLGQPLRGRRRRIRRDAIAVPPPKRAICRHQHLTGVKLTRQTVAGLDVIDHADLREPPRERRCAGDELGQRHAVSRQLRVVRVDIDAGPESRSALIERPHPAHRRARRRARSHSPWRRSIVR